MRKYPSGRRKRKLSSGLANRVKVAAQPSKRASLLEVEENLKILREHQKILINRAINECLDQNHLQIVKKTADKLKNNSIVKKTANSSLATTMTALNAATTFTKGVNKRRSSLSSLSSSTPSRIESDKEAMSSPVSSPMKTTSKGVSKKVDAERSSSPSPRTERASSPSPRTLPPLKHKTNPEKVEANCQ